MNHRNRIVAAGLAALVATASGCMSTPDSSPVSTGTDGITDSA